MRSTMRSWSARLRSLLVGAPAEVRPVAGSFVIAGVYGRPRAPRLS
ncbi:hypothetical protein HNP00_004454 [Arthrobacter sp. AZCC_0090]|nr:hypothetical protein [Arthrobacter sp. AZCC_0090]